MTLQIELFQEARHQLDPRNHYQAHPALGMCLFGGVSNPPPPLSRSLASQGGSGEFRVWGLGFKVKVVA